MSQSPILINGLAFVPVYIQFLTAFKEGILCWENNDQDYWGHKIPICGKTRKISV